MAWDIGNLFKAMKDDKGLFQGGEEGRVGGRLRDKMGGRGTSYDPGMEEGNELSRHAREFAKNMDVSSKEDVFEMQNMLNELGIKDFEGKALKADSMMGDRTLSAMRMLQGLDYEGESVERPEASGLEGMTGINPWEVQEGDEGKTSTMFRNNSPKNWIDILFGKKGKRSGFGNSAAEGFQGYREG
jgi:hypothetical protein